MISVIPSPPWSSSSAPSRVLQLKCFRTSSTTRGVTIMWTSLRTRPSRTNQSGRTILLMTLSLHCRACKLCPKKVSPIFLNAGIVTDVLLLIESRFAMFIPRRQRWSFRVPVKCKEADWETKGVQNFVFNGRDEYVKFRQFCADAAWTQVSMSSNRSRIERQR